MLRRRLPGFIDRARVCAGPNAVPSVTDRTGARRVGLEPSSRRRELTSWDRPTLQRVSGPPLPLAIVGLVLGLRKLGDIVAGDRPAVQQRPCFQRPGEGSANIGCMSSYHPKRYKLSFVGSPTRADIT